MIAICKVEQREGNFKDKSAKSVNKVADIHESATVGIEKRDCLTTKVGQSLFCAKKLGHLSSFRSTKVFCCVNV